MPNSLLLQEFRHNLSSPSLSQQQTLLKITKNNKDTVYGKKHEFLKISREEHFRKGVPLNQYDGLKPYIDRLMNGERNILCHDSIKAFFETSGTTSQPKYIPVTSSFINDKAKAMNIYWKLIYDKFPDLQYKKIVMNFSSGTSFKTTENGIIIGQESDYWNLITRNIKKTSRWPIYYDLLKIDDYEVRYYCIALLLLQDEVGAFMSPNPSTLLVLFKTIEANFPELINDISNGKLSCRVIVKGEYRKKINDKLKASPTRASELSKILTASSGKIPFSKIWPTLRLYSCWQSTMLTPYVDQVSSYLSGIDCWDHLYQASEALIAIPDHPNQRGGILNIIGNYFEFIPESKTDQKNPPTCTLSEVEKGKSYEIVITNQSGLYRYRIGDIIKVVGFKEKTPRIEFEGRTGRVCSMTGEKITEKQISEVFEASKSFLRIAILDYFVFPINDALPHYGLMVFTSSIPPPVILHDFVVAFEKNLCCHNIEYRAKRASLRLGSVKVFLSNSEMPGNCFPRGCDGIISDQTKPTRLSKIFNQHEKFKIHQCAQVG